MLIILTLFLVTELKQLGKVTESYFEARKQSYPSINIY